MAIYHLQCNIGTKLEGHSAGAKCAYITRTEAYAKKADECAYTASGNMPKWPKTNPQEDPAHYWKAADIYERDNGRLFRELEIALPRELNLEQQKALCHAFAEKITNLKGEGGKLPFTFSIHTDKDNHNPHFHLMISERINDGLNRNASTWFKRASPKDPKKGGAIKSQELNGKQWLNPTRETWATMANEALKNADQKATIDHRSNKARGIEDIPTMHLGAKCAGMMKRGANCQRGPNIEMFNKGAKFQKDYLPAPHARAKLPMKAMRQVHTRVSSPLRKDGSLKTWQEIADELSQQFAQLMKTWHQIEMDRLRRERERIEQTMGGINFSFGPAARPTTAHRKMGGP